VFESGVGFRRSWGLGGGPCSKVLIGPGVTSGADGPEEVLGDVEEPGAGRLGAGNTVELDEGIDEGTGDTTFGAGALCVHDAQPGRETVAGIATP